VAGDVIVELSEALVRLTLGGKKPLSEEVISNFADALGVVVPIPTWAKEVTQIKNTATDIRHVFISNYFN
jgi:hypothetical protein